MRNIEYFTRFQIQGFIKISGVTRGLKQTFQAQVYTMHCRTFIQFELGSHLFYVFIE